MNCTQAATFLRKIAFSNAPVSAIGRRVNELIEGNAYFLVSDWILSGYWDSAGFSYLDVMISPQGDVGCYASWVLEGKNPEDLLSSTEFAWLWGLLDQAPAIAWTVELKDRVRAGYRRLNEFQHSYSPAG